MVIPDRSTSVSLGQRMLQLGGGTKIEVAYESYFEILPDTPKTSGWFQGITNEIRQLLTLFLNQPAELTLLQLNPVPGKDVENVTSEWFNDDRLVEWYWNRSDSKNQEIRHSKILIRLTEVKYQLEEVFRKWLSKTEQLQYSRALFFSTHERPAPFLETRFLPIIQAIEVYCSGLGSEKYIPDHEFKVIKKKLLDEIPDGLNDGLTQKLRTSIGFANELSLNDRIVQLINSLDPMTRHFICRDSEKFARLLKDSRNYYTHYGIPKAKALTGKDLRWATEQTSLLLKILILKECGIPESLIQEKLNESGHFKQGARIWAEIEDSR
jgi:hypothetical protein